MMLHHSGVNRRGKRGLLAVAGPVVLLLSFIAGCASVPMGDTTEDQRLKSFPQPPEGTAGLYIFRDSNFGAALKKTITVDGRPIGQSAPMTYFYLTLTPGDHSVATESEFGDNALSLSVDAGKNYFIDQYIKFGVMVGGANIKLVSEEEGKKGVLSCKLAASIYGYESSREEAAPAADTVERPPAEAPDQ